jgi:hypothetical protein
MRRIAVTIGFIAGAAVSQKWLNCWFFPYTGR